MNPRRVLILSLTLLAAGAAGYGLLGLRAPKQALPPPAPAAPTTSGSNATVIAVGPDGTLYAIPAQPGAGGARVYRDGGFEREERGR